MLLSGSGRVSEALVESRRDAELDPFSPATLANYGWICSFVGDHDCAVEQFLGAIEIGDYPPAYALLGVTYARKGMHDEAIRAVRKTIALAPHRSEFLADLAYVQALGGEREAALATLQLAKARPVEGFNIARAYVALQQPDSAFAWLERSSWQWPHRANRLDPGLDPLRSDPRFARLVARIDREMGIR